MSRLAATIRKPIFILAVIFPIALVAEFAVLEGVHGISLPSDRGSAVSSYEIREKGTEVHFITRNTRFSIVDLWSRRGSAVEALVLRESFVIDRQDGIEGDNSMLRVEALDGKRTRWSFEEAGERGQALGQVYEVTKLGCCDAPNTYTYFSLRDGKRLRTSHTELSRDEFASLEKALYD
ncbi:MAG TPA: hypothetical protein VKV39_05720 [Candidatus Sulfotelmatobacter sp.]|nr:hypothetical protein [Candidatus Sulfotelmatobacter sp.]